MWHEHYTHRRVGNLRITFARLTSKHRCCGLLQVKPAASLRNVFKFATTMFLPIFFSVCVSSADNFACELYHLRFRGERNVPENAHTVHLVDRSFWRSSNRKRCFFFAHRKWWPKQPMLSLTRIRCLHASDVLLVRLPMHTNCDVPPTRPILN